MGEKKSRAISNANKILSASRCVYCENKPTTIEHMPPRTIFKNKYRPSGLEFACCETCNNGTSHVDLLVSFISRIQHITDDAVLEAEMLRLFNALAKSHPHIAASLFVENKATRSWVPNSRGILERRMVLNVKDPVTTSLLRAFCLKLTMALFKEHTGGEFKSDGVIETNFFLNAGIDQKTADSYIGMLPMYGNLRQGTINSDGEFGYRYNTDGKSILALLARFHENFTVFSIACTDEYAKRMPFNFPHTMAFRPSDMLGLASVKGPFAP